MDIRKLILAELVRRPFRTCVLVLTAALMTAALFGGQVAAQSLTNGLDSLEQRLGADIIVVPEDSDAKLEDILLQGTTGYFYMDKSVQQAVASVDGVEKTSAQYFLVSANAECCTVQVQLIGFDPQTDFTVKPWLRESFGGDLGKNELIVGSSITTQVGHTLKLYGVECMVAGRLEATGTGLDTAVYTTSDTIRELISAAEKNGISVLSRQRPEDVISSVYIRTAEGFDPKEVAGEINLSADGVRAVCTRSMLTGTAEKLSVISGSISVLVKAVWAAAAVIMTAVFSVLAGVRRREFAVLRTIGFSRKKLAAIVFSESALLSAAGAVLGILLTSLTVFPFDRLIEHSTGLPCLLPKLSSDIAFGASAAAAVMLTSAAAAAFSAYRLSHTDTGRILREGE